MTRHHDAATGRFVSTEYAAAHPDTTVAVQGSGEADKLRALLAEAFPYLVQFTMRNLDLTKLDNLLARIDAVLTEDDG